MGSPTTSAVHAVLYKDKMYTSPECRISRGALQGPSLFAVGFRMVVRNLVFPIGERNI